jgi:serine/threonine-protein kinase RsbW
MMSPTSQASIDRPLAPGPNGKCWLRECPVSLENLPDVVAELASTMRTAAYGPRDLLSMCLAVEEAVVNATKHGHRDRQARPARLRYLVTREQVVVEVEDRGPDFNPEQVADPLAEDNLTRDCGRGLFLMRHCTTWMRSNERGNRVTLCKRKS